MTAEEKPEHEPERRTERKRGARELAKVAPACSDFHAWTLAALTLREQIAAAPWVFLAGVLVGLVLASRYRIRRMNGDKPPP